MNESTAKIAPIERPCPKTRLAAALREAATWAPHVDPAIDKAVSILLAAAERRRHEGRSA